MADKNNLLNIIIFIADEMRSDTVSLGARHNKIIKTPNIDSLKKEVKWLDREEIPVIEHIPF